MSQFFACIITTGIFYRPSPSKSNFFLALIVGFKTLFDCLREEHKKQKIESETVWAAIHQSLSQFSLLEEFFADKVPFKDKDGRVLSLVDATEV